MAQHERDVIETVITDIDKSIDLIERLECWEKNPEEVFRILEYLISAANALEVLTMA